MSSGDQPWPFPAIAFFQTFTHERDPCSRADGKPQARDRVLLGDARTRRRGNAWTRSRNNGARLRVQPEQFANHRGSTVSTKNSGSIENPKLNPDPASNTEKDPDEWVSGDEPMTGAQASYLKTLSEQADEPDAFDTSLTKAEASKRIDELKARTRRTRK
jgi:Protein of unknown function (DUF3072)